MIMHLNAADRIRTAEAELDAWESAVTPARCLKRVTTVAPLHPLVVGYHVGAFFASLYAGLSVAALGTVFISRELAQWAVFADQLAGVSVPMVLAMLGLCCMVGALSLRATVATLGRNYPLLASEARDYCKLRSRILEAQASARSLSGEVVTLAA